jgi:hypothetical protein
LQLTERMTNQHPLPDQTAELIQEEVAQESAGNAVVAGALVPSTRPLVPRALRLSPQMAELPVEFDVCIPVRQFRVRNLLALQRGEVIETQWGHCDDLPLSAGDVQLAWSEFEVVDTRMAVRITRLA